MFINKIMVITMLGLLSIPSLAKEETATLAGGCFWCTESDMEKFLNTDVISGYSGGVVENPKYKDVAFGKTKHIESIQFMFDNEKVSYIDVLDHFIRHIDPTDANGSFYDRGYQYSPAIFFHSDKQKINAENFIEKINKSNIYPKELKIKLIPYTQFWKAEDNHQNYYKKHSLKYKYYRYRSGRDDYIKDILGENKKTLQDIIAETDLTGVKVYHKPSKEVIKKTLSPLQYRITQLDGTEKPFDNRYWKNKKEGIYVDIVSGEPLFSSLDKYDSGTGWPSFTQPINKSYIVEKDDFKLFSKRIEVRSRFGDSHLGHVFEDGSAPTGLRYCINSAALRFIPKEKLKEEGYNEYVSLFK